MGYLTSGFVATLFGLGSAFASNTIAINSNAPIGLGQGVILVTACDSEIAVAPITEMIVEAAPVGPTFYLSELQISGIDATATNAVTGEGCGGTTFDVQIYDGKNVPYSCVALNIVDDPALVVGDIVVPICTGADNNKLSFDVLAAGKSNYIITFDKAPSDISYITLVTR